MLPSPGIVFLKGDEGTHSEFTFLNLDSIVFASRVLAARAPLFSDLWTLC
jgi:hypothetical protein